MSLPGHSLNPDPWMRWIYDYRDPRYNDPATRQLRDARFEAIRSAPEWARNDALNNDILTRALWSPKDKLP